MLKNVIFGKLTPGIVKKALALKKHLKTTGPELLGISRRGFVEPSAVAIYRDKYEKDLWNPAILITAETLLGLNEEADFNRLIVYPPPVVEFLNSPFDFLDEKFPNRHLLIKRSGVYTAKPISGSELIEKLGRYRSVSFDLHGTLVLSHRDWNETIFGAFYRVLQENDLTEPIDHLIQLRGRAYAIQAFVTMAAAYYAGSHPQISTPTETLLDEILLGHPKFRWAEANTKTIKLLFEDFLDVYPHFSKASHRWKKYREHPATKFYKKMHGRKDFDDILYVLGFEVHEAISGSAPDAWYAIQEQKDVVRKAVENIPVVSVISNGKQESVEACVQMHHPAIHPWQVFTPDIQLIPKPEIGAAALQLYTNSMLGIANAVDRGMLAAAQTPTHEQWGDALSKGALHLIPILTEYRNEFRFVEAAFLEACALMGLTEGEAQPYLVRPEQHLHVGNSKFHDSFYQFADVKPMKCVLYAPTDPTKKEG